MEKRCHESPDEPQGGDASSQTLGDSESMDMPESTNSSSTTHKITRTGPLTQNEIATEASAMVYKTITSTLYHSRDASKLQSFQNMTYLFVCWGQHGAPVEQKTVKVKGKFEINIYRLHRRSSQDEDR